jgi:hypothetical protein
MQGTVSEGIVPGLLREIYVGRKTGCLHFTRSDERVSVAFKEGRLVRSETNVPGERLGGFLIKKGLLSEVDLAHATDIVAREKKRLGAALLELGVTDPGPLEEALTDHVREMLVRLFGWTEGAYAFEDQAIDEKDGVPISLSTVQMILEAVNSVEDPDVVRYALGDIDRILGLSPDPLLRFQNIALSPSDGYVLSRVDGASSVRELTLLMTIPHEETEKILFRLLCAGLVEYLPVPPKSPPAPVAAPSRPVPQPQQAPVRPAAPPPLSPEIEARRVEIEEAFEGLRMKNHFEFLGIPKASTEAQVKEAYFRLAKRFHPDTAREPKLADLRSKLEVVFIRLGQAYEVLRNPKTRSEYESDLAARAPRIFPAKPTSPEASPAPDTDPLYQARLAEDLIRRAEKHVAGEKFWDAIQLLEEAVPMVQGKPRHKARVLLAQCYIKNPHWVKQGEELLKAVVRDDPQDVDAYFILGTIYKGTGLKSRADTMFRKVLELQPDHEAAASEVASQAEAPQEKSSESGFLKRLFGKT